MKQPRYEPSDLLDGDDDGFYDEFPEARPYDSATVIYWTIVAIVLGTLGYALVRMATA